jgi:probable phosphoglycerate mutase
VRLLLVRHGLSEWNAAGRWQGWADPPLADVGRQQARAAAEAVGSVDVLVSSDLQRAHETASIIGETIGIGPVVVEPELRERHVGEYTGLTRHEIEARWPGALASYADPPGGETREEVVRRIVGAIRVLAVDHPGADVLAVSHGGVIRYLERHLGEERPPLPNLAGVEVTVHGERLKISDRVLLIDPDEVALTVPRQL